MLIFKWAHTSTSVKCVLCFKKPEYIYAAHASSNNDDLKSHLDQFIPILESFNLKDIAERFSVTVTWTIGAFADPVNLIVHDKCWVLPGTIRMARSMKEGRWGKIRAQTLGESTVRNIGVWGDRKRYHDKAQTVVSTLT